MKAFRMCLAAIALAAAALPSWAAAERDYMRLHRNAIVVDLHSDTVMRMKDGMDFSKRDTIGHMDIPRLKEGGVDLQVFACFIGTDTPKEKCRRFVDEMIDTLDAQVKRHPDQIAICHTEAEAEQIIKGGRIAAFIGVDKGVAIADSLVNVQHFHDRDVRYMTPTHTSSNDWCTSSADTAPEFHGLTDRGQLDGAGQEALGEVLAGY
jgi:membrane dipeptidase